MDNEPEEMIKRQMQETRASLAEKLETLEQQVVGTVHSATSAVNDTVESVKDAVQQTVEMARTSMHDTVEAVKDSLDLTRHVREHPWFMVGGSVTAGFATGYLASSMGGSHRGRVASGNAPSLSTLASASRPERDGGLSQHMREESRPKSNGSSTTPQGLFGNLEQRFDTEIQKLKGLALGSVLGVVRDLITSSAPPQLSAQLAEIVDSATVKLGGQPIRGSMLDMFERDSSDRSRAGATPNSATYAGRTID